MFELKNNHQSEIYKEPPKSAFHYEQKATTLFVPIKVMYID